MGRRADGQKSRWAKDQMSKRPDDEQISRWTKEQMKKRTDEQKSR